MKRLMLMTVMFLCAATAFADDAADVRASEAAFAKAFADRDVAKFSSFLAADAKFIGRKRVLNGKQAIVEVWSKYMAEKTLPFRWNPENVDTNGAGDLAISRGPVYDAAGNHISDFSSVWQKQKDGTWKVIFDGPGAPVCPAKL